MPVETDAELCEILELETIAVVGCSATPGKDAHEIPKFMRERGYEIVPVNPYADEIFGVEPCDPLSTVEEAIDRDDVDVVWTQLGIRDPEAGERVEAAGKRYVEDRCLKAEYQRLME